MRGVKYQVSVDKLTICYKATEETIKVLTEIEEYETWDNIRLFKSESSIFDNNLQIEIVNPNTNRYMIFGHLSFNKKLANDEQSNYVWLYIANKVFYTPFLQKTSTILLFSDYITNSLGLEYNNVTSLDLAINSNVNWAKRIKKAIFNPNLIPVINGKARTDVDEVIEEVLYITKGNQKRMTDLSVYVKQVDGAELRCYDKFDELENTDKEYINEWNNIAHPQRIEVSLKKKHIKKYLFDNKGMKQFADYNKEISVGQLLIFLSDYEKGVIEYIASDSIDKLIHFQDINSKEKISVFKL